MRAVIQRVDHARVTVNTVVKGQIGPGLLIYLGIDKQDQEEDEDYIIDKICNLRIFPNENGKFDQSVLDLDAEVLIISQFTLYGDARKGRRPNFVQAAPPESAIQIYERVIEKTAAKGIRTQQGEFQAHMEVISANNGPVTILIDSKKLF